MEIYTKPVENLTGDEIKNINGMLSTCSMQYVEVPGCREFIVFGQNNDEYLFSTTLRDFPGSGILEIYDVCVKYKGKGIGTKVFEYINDFSKNKKLWLGVLLSNINICKFYIKLGYRDIWITQLSPGGIAAPNFEYFISLVYNPLLPEEAALETVSKFSKICQILNSPRQQFDYNFQSFERLYYLSMKKSTEYGFTVDLVDNKLRVLSSSYVAGSEKAFTVNVPKYIFNGHTHPLTGFVEFYTLLGWPSNTDFMVLMSQSYIIQHYVLSYRGLYDMQTTIELKIFYTFLTKHQKDLFAKLVHDKLLIFNDYRSIKHFDPDLFNSMVYLLSKCRTEEFHKAFLNIIASGGCNPETKLLYDGYILQFLTKINSLTFRDFGIEITDYVNSYNPTLFNNYVNNGTITNKSKMFKIQFFPHV